MRATKIDTPSRKVNAAAAGGSAAIVLTFVLGLLGLDVDPVTAGALSTLGAFIGGYFRREVEVVGLRPQAQASASEDAPEDPNTELYQGF